MATPEPTTSVTAEQLADAETKFKKALELRDTEVETAVELLGQVLEIRNKAFGENALECADTYLYYGECLFEQAQASSDFFGDQMKSAANQRAKAIAAAEDAGADDAIDADASADAENGDDTPAADEAASDKATDEAAPSKETETDAAEAKGAEDTTTTTAEAPADTPTPPAEAPAAKDGASKETSAAAEADDAAAEGAEGADGDEEGSANEDEGSESSSDEGEEGEEGEEGKAEGEEGAAAPEITGESDDMALAWEMLELARLIYNNNGGAETHANKLADCHLYIGDILAEQEKFEAAVEEYKTAQEMLARLEGGHNAYRRRAAELEFKKATALQLLDSPAEALAAMQSAKAHLSTHLASVNADIAKAGSSGADVSGAVASAAFASILGGYASSAPAAADADASAGKESAELAKLHALASELKETIESVNDRIEELTAAVQEHISMKEQLANIFKAVAAEGPSEAQGGSSSEQRSGAVETVGFGGAGSSKAAGEVKDIGVIGKGKRVAPIPVSAEAPAAGVSPAAGGGEDGMGGEGEPKASAAGVGDVGVGKKRALSDLTSSDQEQAAEGEGMDGAVAKLAAAATAAAGEQPDAAPKKARV